MPQMDYTHLLNRAREYGYKTQKDFAEAIGISESHFCQKIAGNYAFSQTEIHIMCELLEIPAEQIGYYFFTARVEKPQQ